VSYGKNTAARTEDEDRNLIRYLIRNRHTSPLEMCELRFHLKIPIFVMRQHVRHRTACLTGNTILDFDLGGSTRSDTLDSPGRHKITVKDVYDRWMFGGFGNRREDYDLSFIDPNEYYTAFNIGEWFINRKSIADSLKINKKMKAKNRKIVDHYKGSDILSFYEQQKNDGKNHHRDLLKQMTIRSLNEDTKEVYHTHISDIWKTGKKYVYEICIGKQNQYQRKIKASGDHLFFTESGWKKLKDINVGDKIWSASSHEPIESNHQESEIGNDEIWVPCYQYENEYVISSYGRVMRIGKARAAKIGLIKQPTLQGDRYVISLSMNSKTRTYHIHRLVLLSFIGKPNDPVKNMCCHKNGNPLDNRVDNLYWGNAQDNANDSVDHGTRTYLSGKLSTVQSKEYVGIEETYDLEVSGPYHNFSANSFIVHNSLNEYSGRYSEMSDEFYFPEIVRLQKQDTVNKQMSAGELSKKDAFQCGMLISDVFAKAYDGYKDCLSLGLSRELARIQLPVANYTELYWKIDIHNFFHYVSLRDDPGHAQREIVELAQIMYRMVKSHVPLCCEAFEDYKKNAVTFSALELEVLSKLLDEEFYKEGTLDGFLMECPFRLKGREVNEFKQKIQTIIRGARNG
jgi:thymidylate synthase (FAD)